ncbi:bifunctional protein-serine/threonine kinase/phosphatase [Shewanella sp. Isolate11]|uniref:bifunctional protein-serine/threonine kinase/phosphatase n=1 Tax=Shewanella sp. Isolate11 TaxID=2908530 RepID=UPI001EFDD3D9|nr:bifunctional protein-serine/threonine kinase/phosphatase [Shewanella sp. Isolate11]MCG9698164.1 bifunctional protein-serine/threonine kinase/phosphatase [Shewanella sp. Isolate11]
MTVNIQAQPLVSGQIETTKKSLQVSFGGQSIAGARSHNQDAFAVYRSSDMQQLMHKGVVACIADGVSCSSHAQQASQLCVTQFIEDYLSTPESWGVKQSAHRVLSSLNSWLYHHSQQCDLQHNSFVSTFSALVVKSNRVHLFHAGDSRVYLYRQGELRQLTRDHCQHQMGNKSFLTRALGMDSHLEVDYQSHEAQQGDLFLLSTDGVHECLSPSEISQSLQQVEQALPLEKIADTLVQQAFRQGSQDNLSCVLLKVEALPFIEANELVQQYQQKVIPPVMDVGNKIDEFEVVKVLYSGSRSHIYLVEHRDSKATYVIKAPSLNYADDPLYLASFVREQWIGQRTQHASLMKVYPYSTPFLYHLCQYVPGQTLRQWMLDHPHAEINQVRSIVGEVVIAIRALQRLAVVHRDLKPENLLLTEDNKVVLIDYGAAQAMGLVELQQEDKECPLGAKGYIAPEYLMGQEASHQSDIFSLAVMIYEMLTGELPYKLEGANYVDHFRSHKWNYISARCFRDDIPVWLDLTLQKACHPQPQLRYQAMSELLVDLTTPNKTLLAQRQHSPLIERDPILFWRTLSVLLMLVILIQALLL